MLIFIALLIKNDGLKTLSFFIFYYMLCSFSHKLNGSGFNPPTHFRHISDKRDKMSVDVAPKNYQMKHQIFLAPTRREARKVVCTINYYYISFYYI